MSEQEESSPPSWKKLLLWSPGPTGRNKRYLLLLTLTMLSIWGTALAYLKFANPVYTCKWSLILPGTGVSAMINLDSIGQATTSSTSAYSSNSISPTVNYKTIIESEDILKRTAKKMQLEEDEFDKPRLNLIDQTTLIFFEVTGHSGEEAQAKSYALYETIQETLQKLRLDENKQREKGVQLMLANFKDKLKTARNRLLEYQAKAEVISIAQFNQLTTALEDLKIKLIELKSEQASLQGERDQLIKILNLDAVQAANALMLQTDPVFQENIKQFAEADALLANQLLKMGDNHPEVTKTRNRWQAAKQKLNERIKILVGKPNSDLLNRLILLPDKTRNELFQKLISLDAANKGISDKILALEKQIAEVKSYLSKSVQAAAMLDDLKREHEIAEAIFTSALARIDTGKSDVYASYPLLQMLSPPNIPEKPTSPRKLFVFLGASGATFFSLCAIVILWIRKPWLQKILQNV